VSESYGNRDRGSERLNEGSNTTDVADPKASRGLPTEMYDNPARILTGGVSRIWGSTWQASALRKRSFVQ
jgi:hypothetical protein